MRGPKGETSPPGTGWMKPVGESVPTMGAAMADETSPNDVAMRRPGMKSMEYSETSRSTA